MKQWNELGQAGKIGLGILFGIGGLVFAAGIALLFGWVLMLLWNWLMPEIFGLGAISYWQAWGLILLSHLLFKGHGAHPGGHKHSPKKSFSRDCHHSDRDDFDDFKREFRARMRHKWHDTGSFEDSAETGRKQDAAEDPDPPSGN